MPREPVLGPQSKPKREEQLDLGVQVDLGRN
jgi:hypothetical protein